MSLDVDTAVLELLRAVPYLRVHDGDVTQADWSDKVISAPLPYVIYYPTPGVPTNMRLAGNAARAQSFTVAAVGETREQAVLIGDKAERALQMRRVDLGAGRLRLLKRDDSDIPVRRDDEWTRPDGGPLFVDSRRYSILAH